MSTTVGPLGNQGMLQKAWDHALTNLEVCLNLIRVNNGYEDSTITVCVLDGKNLDTFTMPGSEWNRGLPGAISEYFREEKRHGSTTDLGKGFNSYASPKNVCDLSKSRVITDEVSFLFGMNIAGLRRVFTSVRDRLGLRNFEWPLSAKKKFMEISNDPVPTAPGRSNSRKNSLILMAQICAELDSSWRKAIIEVVREEKCQTIAITSPGKKQLDKSEGEGCATYDSRTLVTETNMRDGIGSEAEDHIQSGPASGSSTVLDADENSDPPHENDACRAQRAVKRVTLLRMISEVPKDTLRTSSKKPFWPDLSQLLSHVSHPYSTNLWFRQKVTGEGNCLFYSLMVAVGTRNLNVSNIRRVVQMRRLLRDKLKELSRAGEVYSPFRREWLLSCVHDMEIMGEFSKLWESVKNEAYQTGNPEDFELLLAPLREYVSQWADMVGDDHWGALLTAEMSILASRTGSAIEVLGTSDTECLSSPHNVALSDQEVGWQVRMFERRALFLPFKAQLPSYEDNWAVLSPDESTRHAWVGPYPVIRITLQGHHYDACTSTQSFPISGLPEYNRVSSVLRDWTHINDTLVKPYAILTSSEEKLKEKKRGTVYPSSNVCWERQVWIPFVM